MKINYIDMKIFRLSVLLFVLSYTTMYATNKKIDTLGVVFECDTISHKAKVSKVYGKSSHLIVPQYVKDENGESYEVISLGYGALGDSRIKRLKITLPHSILRIGSGAFHDNENLQLLSVEQSVTYISSLAFGNCISLEQLNLKSVNYIGKQAFSKCESLKDLHFLNSVREIGDEAFYECKSLKYFNMPDCLYEIGEGAFMNCTSLLSVRFSNTIHIIRENTFRNCQSLTEIYLPENIKRIRRGAFYNCSNLKKVRVSKNCLIDDYVFPENTVIEFY